MAELETTIEKRFVKWCRRNKIHLRVKLRGELLDRWIFLPGGRLFIIEFKRPGGEVSRRQAREIRILKGLGYDVEIHDDSTKAIEAVKDRQAAALRVRNKRKHRAPTADKLHRR